MNCLSGIGLLTGFGVGVVSFLSLCVLSLVPGFAALLEYLQSDRTR